MFLLPLPDTLQEQQSRTLVHGVRMDLISPDRCGGEKILA